MFANLLLTFYLRRLSDRINLTISYSETEYDCLHNLNEILTGNHLSLNTFVNHSGEEHI